ncbi:hypothetical protein MML48_1g03331 [Holotrichia oblita]|uniref:Uncharacterized protein n=1 Tax=Holotrichia oblita TaxID=644536 RepID=A0ACB9TT28_HOLOL|nr:hypothetical protein MML48_1g03331 [Holotrichia oblita]
MSDSSCTPPEIRKEANQIEYQKLLPEKSKNFYIKVYNIFKDWCKLKKVKQVSENVLLVYFQEQAENRKASSLWAKFSMLKQTLRLKQNIDISKYYKVIALLKRKNDSYMPKKDAVFEEHHIRQFIADAPCNVSMLITFIQHIYKHVTGLLHIGYMGYIRLFMTTDLLCV